jgi:hypothetical protein
LVGSQFAAVGTPPPALPPESAGIFNLRSKHGKVK